MIIHEDCFGGYGHKEYISLVVNTDNCIWQNQLPSWGKLSIAVSQLRGEAIIWWREEEEARWYDEDPIVTWEELKQLREYKYLLKGFPKDFMEPKPPYPPHESSLSTFAAELEGETQIMCGHVPDQGKKRIA